MPGIILNKIQLNIFFVLTAILSDLAMATSPRGFSRKAYCKTTKFEQMILTDRMFCESEELQKLEGELINYYQQAMAKSKEPLAFEKKHREWIFNVRNKAASKDELIQVMIFRINELKKEI